MVFLPQSGASGHRFAGCAGDPPAGRVVSGSLMGSAPGALAVSDDGNWLAGVWPGGVYAFGPYGEVNRLPVEKCNSARIFPGNPRPGGSRRGWPANGDRYQRLRGGIESPGLRRFFPAARGCRGDLRQPDRGARRSQRLGDSGRYRLRSRHHIRLRLPSGRRVRHGARGVPADGFRGTERSSYSMWLTTKSFSRRSLWMSPWQKKPQNRKEPRNETARDIGCGYRRSPMDRCGTGEYHHRVVTGRDRQPGLLGSDTDERRSGQFSWSVTAGALPPGIVLDAFNGLLAGTPGGVAASYAFTVRVLDQATGLSASRAFTINVLGLAITTSSLPDATVNQPYSFQLQAVQPGVVNPVLVWSVPAQVAPWIQSVREWSADRNRTQPGVISGSGPG